MDIKICDPAIGSGAFALGTLSQIVQARKKLDSFSETENSTYNLKLHFIQNSIYGVDLDQSAIDIAIGNGNDSEVDQEDYSSIKPLPNLSFKIMQGDSLINHFNGISFTKIDEKGEAAEVVLGLQ